MHHLQTENLLKTMNKISEDNVGQNTSAIDCAVGYFNIEEFIYLHVYLLMLPIDGS